MYDLGYNPYIFNTAWPLLPIVFEYNIDIGAGASVTVPHGLGFPPLTIVWFIKNGVSIGRSYATVKFDGTNIYIANDIYGNAEAVTASIKCYNIDISIPYEYGEPFADSSSIGFEVPESPVDLRLEMFNSFSQSPAVLRVITSKYGEDLSYTNPVGYPQWALGFLSENGDDARYKCFDLGGNQATPAFFQIHETVVAWVVDSGIGSMVIMRDPLVIPEVVEVTY